MRKAAVTLLEMLIVLAIIVTITAASIPAFIKFTKGARLRAAARDITSSLRTARRYAITLRTYSMVAVYADNYDIESMKNTLSYYETEDSVELKKLPPTVKVVDYQGDTTDIYFDFEFSPRGTVSADTVRVQNENNYMDITVNAVTGRVTIGDMYDK